MKIAFVRGYMRLSKLALCAAACLAGSIAGAQTDVRLDEVYVSDSHGALSTAKVGEPFWVGARFTVQGLPNSRFKFRVETSYARIDTPRLAFGLEPGMYWVVAGPIDTLMDQPVEIKATLDPERKLRENSRSNNTLRVVVQPERANQALEYFAPRTLNSSLSSTISFFGSSRVPQSVAVWFPIPASESFQENTGAAPAFQNVITAEPFGQSVGTWSVTPSTLDPICFDSSFQTTARSARIQFDLLKLLGSNRDASQDEWLLPETLIEVGRPEFRAWFTTVFPSGVQSLSTVEIAEKIYRSILRRTSYYYRPGLNPSALRTLRDLKGDCGGLSALFVALCRTAGIPARTVAGFANGANNWHVWAEFHVAGAGWIPVDPSFAESRLANGSDIPIYFGVIPELNKRVATAFGFDRRSSGRAVSMLQSPAVFWTGSGVQVKSVVPACHLQSN